ncbi:type II toxin-antitoxin system death-on-curing family toxin [Shewanella maritima]|uniref:Type II toxin-antitoxin system death-on-curing family toxin n=1 Tax=Shewanella maritima TaxID=2520507 RepID=A0A411PCV9_9GAMM|nr:type II toxin-antitoxin system death-on-curing family toxin [Shewanella maritima]QBF81272.1 type II toxin-antitoxin system death-on-curing family toxin [Shewanella maritima]
MKLLSPEQVAQIHDDLMETEQGLKARYSLDKIESVVSRIQHRIYYDDEFTPDVFNIAALYAEAIAVGHAFPDGNKRTAFVASLTILSLNHVYPDTLTGMIDHFKESEEVRYPTELLVLVAEKKITHKELANVYLAIFGITTLGLGVVKLVDIIKKLIN